MVQIEDCSCSCCSPRKFIFGSGGKCFVANSDNFIEDWNGNFIIVSGILHKNFRVLYGWPRLEWIVHRELSMYVILLMKWKNQKLKKLNLKYSPCTVGVGLQSLFIGITCLCCFLTDGRRNTAPVTLLHSVLSDVRSKYIKCGALVVNYFLCFTFNWEMELPPNINLEKLSEMAGGMVGNTSMDENSVNDQSFQQIVSFLKSEKMGIFR